MKQTKIIMAEITTCDSIFNGLEIKPTASQSKALFEIEEFLENAREQVFVLRGSAGTGKTTITKAIVKYLEKMNTCVYLLAPTGKAASILKEKSEYEAQTIHQVIYIPHQLEDGSVYFEKRENVSGIRTVYIVDEASMISAERPTSGEYKSDNPLLDDLVNFVKQGHPDNQLIFLGDNYQLKPVNESESLALSAEMLHKKYNLSTRQVTLREVVRQTGGSPVLEIAMQIKESKDRSGSVYWIKPPSLPGSTEALNYYLRYFNRKNTDEIILISKTNDQVFYWNQKIREGLGFKPQTLGVGDVVMLRATWMNVGETVVNGEVGIIESLKGDIEEREGFRFQDVIIKFKAGSREKQVSTKIILDSLENPTGQLDHESMKLLKHDRMKHNSAYRQTQMAKDDSYMNAMRLSYAYAMTCHKAQGSEWRRVLYNSEKLHPADHEWLYTAVTRAKEEVRTWRF